MKMKALLLTVGSFALTACVIGNAYMQKKQFYPSVVFITKSSPSMAVLYVQAFVFVVLMWKLMRKMFFGQLRAAEMEHLIERSWYAVTETCLAFTVFRDDFSPRFVALFTLLLFLKCFHWLGEDRVDYMERSPVISYLFHSRVLSLLAVLGLLDAYFINHAYYSTLIKGASVQLVFGFEYAILLTVVLHIFVKYILHALDLQSENPWDNKAVYLLYTELVLGFIKVILYMLFLAIMIRVHTFPLFAIRPMYLTMRTFKKALNDVIMSRRAIRNMNTLYADATEEELRAGDNVCIICREEMTTGCKKLPCNHIFHTSCLRSWFQRQQTCPTCRMDVLRAPVAAATPRPQPAAAPQQAAPPQPQQPPPVFPGFPMFPGAMPQAPPPQPATPGASSSAGPSSTSGTSSSTAQQQPTGMPGMPPFMMPPFMPMPFNAFMPAPPQPPVAGLSAEELAAMEGTERRHLEARVEWLRGIHAMLDAAMVQLNQYANIMATVSMQQPVLSVPRASGAETATVTATGTQPTVTTTAAASTSSSPPATATKPSPAASSPSAATAPPASSSPAPAQSQSAPSTSTGAAADKQQETLDTAGLEGAVGYSASSALGEQTRAGKGDSPDTDNELSEIRRRRVERFSSNNLQAMDTDTSSETKGKGDNIDLD